MASSTLTQPALPPLLSAHAPAIAELRAQASPLPPDCDDDLFLLRFILSFPDATSRLEAVRNCLEWRAANASLLAGAAAGAPAPHASIIEQHIVAGFHGTSRLGEPLFIVRAGLSSPAAVMSAATMPQLIEYFMHMRAVAARRCDLESRTRGVLVKQISVVHMEHLQLALMDRSYFKVIAETGRLSEFVFPQLLLRAVVVQPPAFFHAVFSLVRPLMSQKLLEKQALCPGRSPGRPSASACPFASARFEVSALPTFLGGSCRCTSVGGCVSCRPNAETRPVPVGGPRAAHMLVPARGAMDILLTARARGAALLYSFAIDDKGLELSAWVSPDEGPDVPLITAVKVKAETGIIEGAVPIPIAGTVTLRFSNTHSIFTGKSLTVTASVEEAPIVVAQQERVVA